MAGFSNVNISEVAKGSDTAKVNELETKMNLLQQTTNSIAKDFNSFKKATESALPKKQDNLIAGKNVSIYNNIVSSDQIDDTAILSDKTYSSEKIAALFSTIDLASYVTQNEYDTKMKSIDATIIANQNNVIEKIGTLEKTFENKPYINDSKATATSVFSSKKVVELFNSITLPKFNLKAATPLEYDTYTSTLYHNKFDLVKKEISSLNTAITGLATDGYGHITQILYTNMYAPKIPGNAGQYWSSKGSGNGEWLDPALTVTEENFNLVTSNAVYNAIKNIDNDIIRTDKLRVNDIFFTKAIELKYINDDIDNVIVIPRMDGRFILSHDKFIIQATTNNIEWTTLDANYKVITEGEKVITEIYKSDLSWFVRVKATGIVHYGCINTQDERNASIAAIAFQHMSSKDLAASEVTEVEELTGSLMAGVHSTRYYLTNRTVLNNLLLDTSYNVLKIHKLDGPVFIQHAMFSILATPDLLSFDSKYQDVIHSYASDEEYWYVTLTVNGELKYGAINTSKDIILETDIIDKPAINLYGRDVYDIVTIKGAITNNLYATAIYNMAKYEENELLSLFDIPLTADRKTSLMGYNKFDTESAYNKGMVTVQDIIDLLNGEDIDMLGDFEGMTLQEAFEAEVNERLLSDNEIREELKNEEFARIDADSKERSERELADSEIREELNNEKEERIAAIAEEARVREEADTAERSERLAADTALQENINNEAAERLAADTALQENINNEAEARVNADTALDERTTAIENKIPAQATAENQLADKDFVNSSIATNTAYFIGTFNSEEELNAYSGTLTNNDYAFVKSQDEAGNTIYTRYKRNTSEWVKEYALNNTGFTAEQWKAVNSGITAEMIPETAAETNPLVAKTELDDLRDVINNDISTAITDLSNTITDVIQPELAKKADLEHTHVMKDVTDLPVAKSEEVIAGDTWTDTTLKGSYSESPFATFNNLLLLANKSGGIKYSTDGKIWTDSNQTDILIANFLVTDNICIAIGYGDGLYWTEDGKVWTACTTDKGVIGTGIFYDAYVYGNGIFVACAYGIALYTSTDGKTWSYNTDTASATFFKTIKYFRNKFIAAGSQGIYTSTDAKTWLKPIIDIPVTMGSITELSLKTSESTILVASTDTGLYYSTDMHNWKASNVETGTYSTVCTNGSIFVAAADVSYAGIKYSEDGKTWTDSNVTTARIRSIRYINGIFFAHGGYYSNETGTYDGIYYSTDGKTWTHCIDNGEYFIDVVYLNNMYLAGCNNANQIWYSTDGKAWTKSNVEQGLIYNIAYSNNIYVAAGSQGLYFSQDGITWAAAPSISGSHSALVYANGKFVSACFAIGGGQYGIQYSENGINWTATNKESTNYNSIIYEKNLFIATPTQDFKSSAIAYSEDGVTWSDSNLANINVNRDMLYVNGTFYVAAGITSTSKGIYYSTDGKAWTKTSAPDAIYTQFSYANGYFYATDDSGNKYHSADGISNWTAINVLPKKVPLGEPYTKLCSNNNDILFAYCSSNTGERTAAKYTSGIWEHTTLSDPTYMCYSNGIFMASGKGIYYSNDGDTWTESSTPENADYSYHEIQFANGYFYTTLGNTVKRSTDGTTWEATTIPGTKLTALYYDANKEVYLAALTLTNTDSNDSVYYSAYVAPQIFGLKALQDADGNTITETYATKKDLEGINVDSVAYAETAGVAYKIRTSAPANPVAGDIWIE